MEEMIITVKPGGAVKIEVDGVAGPRCKQVSEGIEKRLGKVTKDTEKAEYYEQDERTSTHNQTGR